GRAGRRGIHGLAFSPGGELLAGAAGPAPCADHDHAAYLWKAPGGAVVAELPPRLGSGRPRVEFSPDGKNLLTADGDGVRLWDPAGKAESWSLAGLSGGGARVAVSPGRGGGGGRGPGRENRPPPPPHPPRPRRAGGGAGGAR